MLTHTIQSDLIGADFDSYLEIMPELSILAPLPFDEPSDNEPYNGESLSFSLVTALVFDYPFVALALIAAIAFACVV